MHKEVNRYQIRKKREPFKLEVQRERNNLTDKITIISKDLI